MTANAQTQAQQGKTGTVRLHRVMKAPPERVYKAFLDADALVKWMAPHGFTAKVHSIDPKVGGGFHMSFTNFGTGESNSFGGKYLELKPYELLRYTDKFDDPNLPGEMTVTITLREVMPGVTEVNIVQEGVPAVIPVEFAYMGWQESLDQLKNLVEPDIPSGSPEA